MNQLADHRKAVDDLLAGQGDRLVLSGGASVVPLGPVASCGKQSQARRGRRQGDAADQGLGECLQILIERTERMSLVEAHERAAALIGRPQLVVEQVNDALRGALEAAGTSAAPPQGSAQGGELTEPESAQVSHSAQHRGEAGHALTMTSARGLPRLASGTICR